MGGMFPGGGKAPVGEVISDGDLFDAVYVAVIHISDLGFIGLRGCSCISVTSGEV